MVYDEWEEELRPWSLRKIGIWAEDTFGHSLWAMRFLGTVQRRGGGIQVRGEQR